MPEGGYTANSESMHTARIKLQEAAEGPQTFASKLKPTTLAPEDFGKAHAKLHGEYAGGVDQAGSALEGLAGELTSLGGGVGAAGASYASTEDTNAAAMRQQGGGL